MARRARARRARLRARRSDRAGTATRAACSRARRAGAASRRRRDDARLAGRARRRGRRLRRADGIERRGHARGAAGRGLAGGSARGGRRGRRSRGRGLPAPGAAPQRPRRSHRRRTRDRPAAGEARRRRRDRGRAERRRVAPAACPSRIVASVRLALVTEAGCVPQGNPDRLPTRHANVWLRYDLAGVGSLAAGDYESVHAGFDTTAANADPNRLVPLDAARALQREGIVGLPARRVLHDDRAWTRPWPRPRATGRRSRPSCGRRRSGR